MKLILCFISLLVLMVGCGSKNAQKPKSTVAYFPMGENETLDSSTAQLSLSSNTPPGVGSLLSLREAESLDGNMQFGICTWFLVDKNKAMTNSHCVPDKLKENPALNCSSYLQGAFSTREGVKKTKCKKVIFFSNIPEPVMQNNDYALIELSDSFKDANIFQLNRTGFHEDQKIKILSMHHKQSSSGAIQSDFKEFSCIVKSSDIFGYIKSSNTSPIVGFKEQNSAETCRAVSGNSGSPAVNYNGDLLGILHGAPKDVSLAFSEYEIASNKMTEEISVVTNLKCQKFNDPVLDAGLPGDCVRQENLVPRDFTQATEEFVAKIDALLTNVMQNDEPDFLNYDFKINKNKNVTHLTVFPKCVIPMEDWSEESLSRVRSTDFLHRTLQIDGTIHSFLIKDIVKIDYYGQLLPEVEFVKAGNAWIKLSALENLKKKGYALMQLSVNSGGISMSFSEKKLMVCAK